jgi:hypothetical protein
VALHDVYEERRASQAFVDCEWHQQFMGRLISETNAGRIPDDRGYEEHVRSCPACSSRDAWEAANPFPLAFPDQPFWSRVVGALIEPLFTDNVAIPILIVGGTTAGALLMRFALPPWPYWEGVIWPAAWYAGLVAGTATYRVLRPGLGDVGVGAWVSRFASWTIGLTLGYALPTASGYRSAFDDSLNGPPDAWVMAAVIVAMSLFNASFIRGQD